MTDIHSLLERNRAGEPIGLPCFCTANEHVVRSIFRYAADHHFPVVIEATCNQVNQDGGYTGMNAEDFSRWVSALGTQFGVVPSNIVLGGDHLGPNPWRHLPADRAMAKADALVRDFAAAGFRKIHLDASMACGNESTPSFKTVAERAARLCKIAETYSPHPDQLVYIIGTEVPIPGGETDDMDTLTVTSVQRLRETIDTHQVAFARLGMEHVWERIVSVVTQPGVDFSHTAIHRFEPAKAEALSHAVQDFDHLTFEAHSTDYQPTKALQELVAKHFFFLKVGPELTFRMREAVFALAHLRDHLLSGDAGGGVLQALDEAMDNKPENWEAYYRGTPEDIRQLRHFSYSDRIRYYWTEPLVKTRLDALLTSLAGKPLPDTVISQYFPRRAFGEIQASPEHLVADHVSACTERYYEACGFKTG